MQYGSIGAGCVILLVLLFSWTRSSVKESELVFSEVTKGTIEVSVSASGKVVPAFEEIINTRVLWRCMEKGETVWM